MTYAFPGPTMRSTRRDRLGSVGERGDRLGAADRVDLVEPELAGDDEGGIDGVRRHDCDPPHARDERGHGGHHERRGQREACRSARRRRPSRAGASAAPRRCPGRLDGRVGRPLRLVERAGRPGSSPAAPRARRPRRARRRSRSGATRNPSGRGPSKRSVHSSSAASPRSARRRRSAPRRRSRRRAPAPLTARAARSAARGSTLRPRREAPAAAPRRRRRRRRRGRRSSPSSASWSTVGAPMLGSTARIAGSVSRRRVHHHVAPAAGRDDAGQHQLEPLDEVVLLLDRAARRRSARPGRRAACRSAAVRWRSRSSRSRRDRRSRRRDRAAASPRPSRRPARARPSTPRSSSSILVETGYAVATRRPPRSSIAA